MKKLFTTLTLLVCPLMAANEGVLLSAGYASSAPLEIAPGQVLTLFLRGVPSAANGQPRSGSAQSVPLPATLAGISAAILQVPGPATFPLPVLAVRQWNDCDEVSLPARPICLLTEVRVQIPVEITPVVAKLVVTVDGEASRTFLVRPVRDDAHVVTNCDLIWDTNPGSVCSRMVFHNDGTVVDEKAPAKPGETLLIYAHGLGPTQPQVPAGTAAPASVKVIDAVARQLKVSFVVFRNAPGSLPRYFENDVPGDENTVGVAGLTQGQVGLYHITAKVPASLTVPILCGGDTRSNVIAKVSTVRGVENIALCVAP